MKYVICAQCGRHAAVGTQPKRYCSAACRKRAYRIRDEARAGRERSLLLQLADITEAELESRVATIMELDELAQALTADR